MHFNEMFWSCKYQDNPSEMIGCCCFGLVFREKSRLSFNYDEFVVIQRLTVELLQFELSLKGKIKSSLNFLIAEHLLCTVLL